MGNSTSLKKINNLDSVERKLAGSSFPKPPVNLITFLLSYSAAYHSLPSGQVQLKGAVMN